MSSVDGPKAGSQDIGEALVAALGFEPTTGASTKNGDGPLDGQPDIIWSDDETGEAADRRSQGPEHQSQDPIVVADGKSSGSSSVPAPPEVADSSMSPAKGKGKGPRKLTTDATAGDTKGKPSGKATKKSGSKSQKTTANDVAEDTAKKAAKNSAKNSPKDSTTDTDQAGVEQSDLEQSDVDLFDKTVEVRTGITPSSNGESEDPDITGPMAAVGSDVALGLDETGPMKISSGERTEVAPKVVAEAVPPAETIVVENGIPMVENQPTIGATPPPPLLEQPTAPPAVEQPTASPLGAPGPVPTSPPTVNGESAASRAVSVPEILDRGIFKRKKRIQARKVRRVVRHIDPWSVLTFSVLFFLCLYAALLLSSVLVWNAAVAAGTIEKIESFIRELGDYETYEIDGDVVFRATMIIAGVLTLASSVLVVLLSVVFNLISDLIGGIRLTVIEEETVRVKGD